MLQPLTRTVNLLFELPNMNLLFRHVSLGGEWKVWLEGLGGLDPLTVQSVKGAL